MNLAEKPKEFFTAFLDHFGLAWWVEIVTTQPKCTYYFGPFANAKEAEIASSGYIEDLKQESAQGIAVVSKQCQPKELTIFDEQLA